MKTVLLETHARAWSLTADKGLSRGAIDAMRAAETVLLSPISFFEMARKVRLGKWPQTAADPQVYSAANARAWPAVNAVLAASDALAASYSEARRVTRSPAESTSFTAPMPWPQPQMSFHALAD